MDKNEFLEFLESSQNDIYYLVQQEKACMADIATNLFDQVLRHLNLTGQYRKQIREPLMQLTNEYAQKVLSDLDCIEYLHYHKKETPKMDPVPRPLTEQDVEKEVLEFTQKFPHINAKEWRNAIGEDFEDELKNDQFKHCIHQEMKKGLTNFFEKNIISFDSGHLRVLDKFIFLTALTFIAAAYELEDEIKEKSS